MVVYRFHEILDASQYTTIKMIIFPCKVLLALIWGVGEGVGGWVILHPLPTSFWFFLNDSETVKATILAFGILYLPQSPDIGQNSDGDISDFRISGQSLINRNFS